MTNEKNLYDAIRICSGGVGFPLSEDVLNEVRFGRENHPEEIKPYDEKKLIEGAKVFFDNHPFIKEFN